MITGINNNGFEYGKSNDGIGGTLSLERDADGRIIIKADNATAAEIDGVGVISGTAQLKFTVTDEDDVTAFEYTHEGDSENNLKVANVENNHYNIKGENANVTSFGGNAERMIQVDASNSNIDLSSAGGSSYVYLSKDTHDNTTKLGYGNDNYIDAGKFNKGDALGGTNRFETTSDSHGAVITGGAGNDTFTIGGKYGVIDGGAGNDQFNAMGNFGENAESSYRNIILGGGGNDAMTDKGGYNIFFGGDGTNSFEVYGQSGIAYLGKDSEGGAIIGSSADKSYVFTDEEVTSSYGTTYKLTDIMRRYNWSLSKFLNVYSQVNGKNKESIATHGLIDAETMKKLEEYFKNNQ